MAVRPYYRRRLPHWHPTGRPLFITFRLHGSLPAHQAAPAACLTSGQAFAWLDRQLDTARSGPLFLGQPHVATIVESALLYGATTLRHYALHAFVIMANHVHLLITPHVAVPVLLKSLKAVTARRANRELGLTGQAFWQDESYDHVVRSDEEFARIVNYIEQNPVKAGLCASAEDWAWSSALKRVAVVVEGR